MRHILSAALALTLIGLARDARAQEVASAEKNLAAARVLYDEAARARDAKDFAVACPKLEEVVRLVPEGVGGRLTLAQCYEGAGKLASAHASYLRAEVMARDAKQPERQQQAHDAAEALKPRLATLTITVADDVRSLAGLEIQCDGVKLDVAQRGAVVAVDRGRHVVVAAATARLSQEKAIDVPADGVSRTVTIDALTTPPIAPPGEAPPPTTNGRRVGGLVTMGLGIVGLGAGGVTGVLALVEHGAAERGCPLHRCSTEESVGHVTTGHSLSLASTVALATGAVGVGVGGYLVWSSSERPTAPTVGFTLLLDRGRIGLRGTF